MFFWNWKKNWEDEYDEYYAQDRGSERSGGRPRARYLAHLLALGLCGGLLLAGVSLVNGKTMVEKFATALASPVGLIWVGLMMLVYFSLLNRQLWPASVGLVLWLILTVAGNFFVANGLATWLESPYQDINPYQGDQPYALVVVLGGGTNTTLSGQSQLAMNGDRVAVAARIYHAGRTQKIICTGSQTFKTEHDLNPREEAYNILVGLGVPQDRVLQMKGNNTSEEMKNLKTWIDRNQISGEVGIVTSAWHLSRAIRLAESNGLEVTPIPANFISEPYAPQPSVIVPTADKLLITGRVCKELLAGWVGR